MANAKFQYSKAYFKILELIQSNPSESVFIIRGGQGAGKTVSILQLIIQSLLSSEKEATVLSSELSKMKRTVIRDYKKIAKDWGIIQDDTDFNRSESKQELVNGSYIDFLGADVNDIGKGFRRDILYINEADKLDVDTAVQFVSRAGLTLIDYNPDSRFWGDDYVNENNLITLTFEDNEYLSASEVKSILDYKTKGFFNPKLPYPEIFDDQNIKNKYWANKWKVYGLGLVGSLDGVVFQNWQVIDNIPEAAKNTGYGLDFGYTNDPTALVNRYTLDGAPIFDEVIYQTGLQNFEICKLALIRGISKTAKGFADSSEPKSIDEIRGQGFNLKPVRKGRDSINYGIQLLQKHEVFYVTRRSINLIKELENYTWDKDRQGNAMNKPIDAYNHGLDSIRYVEMELASRPTRAQATSPGPLARHKSKRI